MRISDWSSDVCSSDLDRAQSRHQAAPRLHGRADRRARRVGTGAPARPAARADRGFRPVGDHRHARPRRGTNAVAPHAGHAPRRGSGDGPHRSGARRPAAPLYPAPRLLAYPAMTTPPSVLSSEVRWIGKRVISTWKILWWTNH